MVAAPLQSAAIISYNISDWESQLDLTFLHEWSSYSAAPCLAINWPFSMFLISVLIWNNTNNTSMKLTQLALLALTDFVICYRFNNVQGDPKYWVVNQVNSTQPVKQYLALQFTIFWGFNWVSKNICTSSWMRQYPAGSKGHCSVMSVFTIQTVRQTCKQCLYGMESAIIRHERRCLSSESLRVF